MNKKVMIGIIIAIIVVALGVGAYFIFVPKTNNTNVTLDLQTVSANITNAGFSETMMMELDTAILSSVYKIDEANVAEVVGKMPMINVQASMYLIIKAADGKVDEVKAKVEEYGQSYEQQWATYLPAQHELVQNRKVGKIGNYVYMVIAENAEDLVKLIK